MKRTFYIRNMVCDRCKTAVEQLIRKNHGHIIDLQLGRVEVETLPGFDLEKFSGQLKKEGFKLIRNPDIQLTESVKINLLKMIEKGDFPKNFTTYLADRLNKDYSILAKTFKRVEEETIEKYLIRLKIEKVKEHIQMQAESFSEIAYRLGYNSISHLSGQFKAVTGMTMSEYRDTRNWARRPIDKIL